MEATSGAEGDELAFGPFSIDSDRVELRKNGRICRIQPQPLRILVHLAERPGRLVTRDELRHAVWGDGVAVDAERGLNFAINQIRTVLGDSARQPRFIETVPRRGYRFVAAVERASTLMELAAPPESPRRWSGRSLLPSLLAVSLGVAVLVVAALSIAALRRTDPAPVASQQPPAREIRLAVLPFEPLAFPHADRSVAGSFTADLIARLARRAPHRLAVIGRRSVQRFAGGGASIAEAGELLNVAWIVDGSLAVEDGRVRIHASLIDSNDESVRWSESFESGLDELPAITERITLAVATSLDVQGIGGGISDNLSVVAGAYRLYARGRAFEREQSNKSWQRAAAAYRSAIDLAPDFAPAYAALALLQVQASFVSDRYRLDEARSASLQALALDPQLPEAHFAAAVLSFHADRDLDTARRHFHRALELAPRDAHLLSWYASFQVVDGQAAASATSAELALALDPLSSEAWIDAGYADYLSGRFDQARARFERGLELGTIGPLTTAANIVNCWQMVGDLESAALAARQALEHSNASAALERWTAAATAVERIEVLREVRLESLRADGAPGLDYLIAIELAALGRRDEAITALQSAAQQGDLFLPFLAVDPMLRDLQDDPRVREIVGR